MTDLYIYDNISWQIVKLEMCKVGDAKKLNLLDFISLVFSSGQTKSAVVSSAFFSLI